MGKDDVGEVLTIFGIGIVLVWLLSFIIPQLR